MIAKPRPFQGPAQSGRAAGSGLRAHINLASDPFRRERALNAAYALACVALMCLLVMISGLFLHERARASRLRADIAAEQRTLEALRNEQSRYSGVLARPRNADIFSRSVFLNELIARRSVSWTRVFEDLQTVMPSNMRLEAIRLPQAPSQQASNINRVQLDMSIGTDKPESVITLLKNLEASSLFGAATVITQTPPTQNDPLFKFRVSVFYAQKL
jgi:Tfp pilus assembly protein PilN